MLPLKALLDHEVGEAFAHVRGSQGLKADAAFLASAFQLPDHQVGEPWALASKGQLTGMRGVYLVAAELARLGFIASPTSRSALGADLLVTDQTCQRAYSVQVKTNASTFGHFLVGKHALTLKSETHLYVLVNLRPKREPEFYVVPSLKLIELAERGEASTGSVWYVVICSKVTPYQNAWEAFGKPA